MLHCYNYSMTTANTPTPTSLCMEISMVEHHMPTNKWAVHFATRRSPEDDTIVSKVCSAPVFDTKDDAYAGGARAIAQLLCRGTLPNLCEPF
jgi:hypothetical protein